MYALVHLLHPLNFGRGFCFTHSKAVCKINGWYQWFPISVL